MSKFKIGDRVAVYGHSCLGDRELCEVVAGKAYGDDITVRPDNETRTWDAHPKQCRRLKKHKLRRVWVKFDPPIIWAIDKPEDGFTEFVEVRKNKKESA